MTKHIFSRLLNSPLAPCECGSAATRGLAVCSACGFATLRAFTFGKSFRWLPSLYSLHVALLSVMMCSTLVVYGQSVCEDFSPPNPVDDGRFIELIDNTESRFSYDPVAANLRAVLDVDASPAYYLSTAFPAISDLDDTSFSVRFRVETIDAANLPEVFVGFGTTTHIGANGHGVGFGLSTTNGRPLVSAAFEVESLAGETNSFRGREILLEQAVDYLAVATYRNQKRELALEVYVVGTTTNLTNYSTVILPGNRQFSVDRLGLENNGFKTRDYTEGSITLTVDDLCSPASYPNRISVPAAVSVLEGNPGAVVEAVFQLELAPGSSQEISVRYATADGTAIAGKDYFPTNGVATFGPGVRTVRIPVQIIPDKLNETNETFFLNLTDVEGASLDRTQVTATIIDDDPLPSLTIDSAELVESNANMLFNVHLSEPSGQTVTFNYQSEDANDPALTNALAEIDYTPVSGQIVFPPGMVLTNISVPIIDDAVPETNEVFNLKVTSATNTKFSTAPAVGTIDDDDHRILSVSDASVTEGDMGTTPMGFAITLNTPHTIPVTVVYSLVSGTAIVGKDVLATSGQLTFAPMETNKTVTVEVVGDLICEPTEEFSVQLSNPVGAGIGKSKGIGTILDDDAVPNLTIDSPSVQEGAKVLTFRLQLDRPPKLPFTNSVSTLPAATNSISRFVPTNGVVVFPTSSTSQTFAVAVLDNALDEDDETVRLRVSNFATCGTNEIVAVGTIIDDDDPPQVILADARVKEGDSGTTNAIVLISLSKPSGKQVTVSYRTEDGTASAAANDYVPAIGSVTFNANETSHSVAVAVKGDILVENDEWFSFAITSVVNGERPVGPARITITNDDFVLPCLSVADATVIEGTGGVKSLIFNVQLSSPTGKEISVTYETVDGTASAPSDYTRVQGTLRFTPGPATSQSISVPIVTDNLDEDDETFSLKLSNPTNATLCTTQARGTIQDDDLARLSIDDVKVTEGDLADTDAILTVSLSPPSSKTISANFNTVDGTATAPDDYVPTAGSIVFAPGETSKQIRIQVRADRLCEPAEFFTVNLTSTNVPVSQGIGTVTIIDNDCGSVTAPDIKVLEGNTGDRNMAVFILRLSAPSVQQVTVNYRTVDRAAQAGSDYLSASGVVTFKPGDIEASVRVEIVGDEVPEPDETFVLALSNPVNAVLAVTEIECTILNDDNRIVPVSASLTKEGCFPANRAIDPLEDVTVEFCLRNEGTRPATNLVATLLPLNGVIPIPGCAVQSFGPLGPNTNACRPFCFKVDGACGARFQAVLKLSDGLADLGTISFSLQLGTNVNGVVVCCARAGGIL